METFICAKCGLEKEVQKNGGTGYATNSSDEKICYSCCAIEDTAYMINNDRIVLYLSKSSRGFWQITNCPGTLIISNPQVKIGKHNIAGYRYGVWFTYAGKNWHGVQYGENTEILHCRKVK